MLGHASRQVNEFKPGFKSRYGPLRLRGCLTMLRNLGWTSMRMNTLPRATATYDGQSQSNPLDEKRPMHARAVRIFLFHLCISESKYYIRRRTRQMSRKME